MPSDGRRLPICGVSDQQAEQARLGASGTGSPPRSEPAPRCQRQPVALLAKRLARALGMGRRWRQACAHRMVGRRVMGVDPGLTRAGPVPPARPGSASAPRAAPATGRMPGVEIARSLSGASSRSAKYRSFRAGRIYARARGPTLPAPRRWRPAARLGGQGHRRSRFARFLNPPPAPRHSADEKFAHAPARLRVKTAVAKHTASVNPARAAGSPGRQRPEAARPWQSAPAPLDRRLPGPSATRGLAAAEIEHRASPATGPWANRRSRGDGDSPPGRRTACGPPPGKIGPRRPRCPPTLSMLQGCQRSLGASNVGADSGPRRSRAPRPPRDGQDHLEGMVVRPGRRSAQRPFAGAPRRSR